MFLLTLFRSTSNNLFPVINFIIHIPVPTQKPINLITSYQIQLNMDKIYYKYSIFQLKIKFALKDTR